MSQLFSQLDEAALNEISLAATIKQVARGELIFSEGDPALFFCIVGIGSVKIFKLSPEGKEQILMVAKPGDSFAEAALFDDGLFPASAQALERGEIMVINREKFVGLLGRNPSLAGALIARLSHLLKQLTKLVEELSLSDVTTRLAHYIIECSERENQPPLTEIRLPDQKTVLASRLGTIPETLSRSFARLTKEKIISVDGPHIRILDPHRLRHLVANP